MQNINLENVQSRRPISRILTESSNYNYIFENKGRTELLGIISVETENYRKSEYHLVNKSWNPSKIIPTTSTETTTLAKFGFKNVIFSTLNPQPTNK